MVFCLDIILNFLTAYEDDNGELVANRKQIARQYLKTWFLIDLFSSFPIVLVQQYTNMNVTNLKFVKLSRLPRLYRLLRLVKLIRFYRSNQFIGRVMKAININPTTGSMISLLFIMIFILHFIGCIWATLSEISFTTYPDNWM